jgi:hypothetical protein
MAQRWHHLAWSALVLSLLRGAADEAGLRPPTRARKKEGA